MGERFASLAEGFRKLGDVERAESVAGWARPPSGHPPRRPPGGVEVRKDAVKPAGGSF